jgi:hypothetical protein
MDPNYSFLGAVGIIALWLLFLALRGFVTRKPFLIAERWVVTIPMSSFFAVSLLNALTGHGMLRWFFPVIFIVLIAIPWFRPRAYVVYGVTTASLREAILASLTNLNITYEETPTGLRLATTGADLEVTGPRSWWKTGNLKMKQREFDALLRDIAKGMDEYYQSGAATPMNMGYSVVLVAAVILYVVCAAGILFFDF